MAERRSYDNRRRRDRAEMTRQRIIDAAGRRFRDQGYSATTLGAIADEASVSVELVKKSMGTKRALLRCWFDQQVAGPENVPVAEQEWLAKLPHEPELGARIDLAAAAVTSTMARAAAAVAVMTAAAHADPDIADMWATERDARRADVANIVALVLGDVVPSLAIDDLVDAVYALTEAHIYLVLVEERCWTPDQYQRWLRNTVSSWI